MWLLFLNWELCWRESVNKLRGGGGIGKTKENVVDASRLEPNQLSTQAGRTA